MSSNTSDFAFHIPLITFDGIPRIAFHKDELQSGLWTLEGLAQIVTQDVHDFLCALRPRYRYAAQ